MTRAATTTKAITTTITPSALPPAFTERSGGEATAIRRCPNRAPHCSQWRLVEFCSTPQEGQASR